VRKRRYFCATSSNRVGPLRWGTRQPEPWRSTSETRGEERGARILRTLDLATPALVAGSQRDGRGAAAGGADRTVLGAGNGAVQLRAAAGRAGARGHLPPGALRLLRALRPPGPRQGTRCGRWASRLLHVVPQRRG
jgi:hypothetical protein